MNGCFKGWSLLFFVAFFYSNAFLKAQTNTCGSQRIEIILGGVIDIGFHEASNNNVNFSFNNAQELANGQYSSPQILHVAPTRVLRWA